MLGRHGHLKTARLGVGERSTISLLGSRLTRSGLGCLAAGFLGGLAILRLNVDHLSFPSPFLKKKRGQAGQGCWRIKRQAGSKRWRRFSDVVAGEGETTGMLVTLHNFVPEAHPEVPAWLVGWSHRMAKRPHQPHTGFYELSPQRALFLPLLVVCSLPTRLLPL